IANASSVCHQPSGRIFRPTARKCAYLIAPAVRRYFRVNSAVGNGFKSVYCSSHRSSAPRPSRFAQSWPRPLAVLLKFNVKKYQPLISLSLSDFASSPLVEGSLNIPDNASAVSWVGLGWIPRYAELLKHFGYADTELALSTSPRRDRCGN